MCAAALKYLPGDVVWVKVSRYPWWPAEVVAQQDCKIPNNGKKDPVAYITFPCEDAYDIIRSESNIMPFDSENKKNFIKKGENLPKDLKEKFFLALRTSQKALRKQQGSSGSKSGSTSSSNSDEPLSASNSSDSPFTSARHFPNREPSFLQDSPTSFSTTTNTSASSILKSAKNLPGNYTNEISDHLRYSCGQCNFSTSRLNLMLIHYKPEENVLRCPNLPESLVVNAESRKRRLAESDAYLRNQQVKTSRKTPTPVEPAGRVPCYARIPASPPAGKLASPAQRDRGSCYMFHDEPVKQPTHKPSFSYRSLQKNKASVRKGDVQNAKRSLSSSFAATSSSSSPPSPDVKTYTKLKTSKEQRNGVLSPRKSEKRKERQGSSVERKGQREERHRHRRHHQQQQQQQQKAPPAEKPQFLPELVLPTPLTEESLKKSLAKDANNKEGKEKALKEAKMVCAGEKMEKTKGRPLNSDLVLANKVASSDEDSSCSTDDEVADGLSAMKSDLPVVENDMVWVKFNKYPFWPALISKVYTKKHHIYRLSVRFFGEILAKETLDFGMSYSKDTVIAFNDPRKEEFIKQGEESEWKEKFADALQKVNDFINKKDGETTLISDEQYLCKSNTSSPDPSQPNDDDDDEEEDDHDNDDDVDNDDEPEEILPNPTACITTTTTTTTSSPTTTSNTPTPTAITTNSLTTTSISTTSSTTTASINTITTSTTSNSTTTSSSSSSTTTTSSNSNSTPNQSSWYPVQNVNIVEETQAVHVVSSGDLVGTTEDVCQTVLELENSESSKDFSAPTVSVMPEIWIPSVDESIGSEVVLHDIEQEHLDQRESA